MQEIELVKFCGKFRKFYKIINENFLQNYIISYFIAMQRNNDADFLM